MPALAEEAGPAPPATPVVVSVDRHLSPEAGADLTRTVAGVLGRAEARACDRLDAPRALGIPLRAVRTALLDVPVAWWWNLVEHEAFGHAAVARELGVDSEVRWGSPWRRRSTSTRVESASLDPVGLLRLGAGGLDANTRTATLLEREIVGGARPSPFELLLLAASRLHLSDYALSTTPDPAVDPAGFQREAEAGGDGARYLTRLQSRFHGGPGLDEGGPTPDLVADHRRLRRQGWWNLADPGTWLALYGAGRHVVTGERAPRLPLPRLRGRTVLPLLSSTWTPEGSLASLELAVGPRRDATSARWTSAVVRWGGGPEGRLWAVGAGTERFASLGPVRFGGEAEAWNRPAGAGLRVRARLTRGRAANLFVDLGVKAAGHWPGFPVGAGPILRLGVERR